MDRALLDAAVERAPVSDDGRSGAMLERVVLADGGGCTKPSGLSRPA